MREFDADLAFLGCCTDTELEPLLDALLDTNHKGRISSELDTMPRFRRNYPRHSMYADLIADELQRYGGNTIANFFRGGGISYWEMLRDVCDLLEVDYGSSLDVADMEEKLLSKVIGTAFAEMSQSERYEILSKVSKVGDSAGGITSATAIALFRAGGFESYQLAMVVVNKLWMVFFKKGLSLAANSTICRLLAISTGPVGIGISAVWTTINLGSPTMRVTVPATIYISLLRFTKKEQVRLVA